MTVILWSLLKIMLVGFVMIGVSTAIRNSSADRFIRRYKKSRENSPKPVVPLKIVKRDEAQEIIKQVSSILIKQRDSIKVHMLPRVKQDTMDDALHNFKCKDQEDRLDGIESFAYVCGVVNGAMTANNINPTTSKFAKNIRFGVLSSVFNATDDEIETFLVDCIEPLKKFVNKSIDRMRAYHPTITGETDYRHDFSKTNWKNYVIFDEELSWHNK